eukprot:TRINITY_DN4661_c0_g2_i1.p1 TRINITY_DN4661_c0_g2~~TRINITY_DN4661_c0_g2_i1.p1  ORF type:complete len:241 (+),score=72.46 TRINITY_DN4661_c0_g2_i1:48-770(+)
MIYIMLNEFNKTKELQTRYKKLKELPNAQPNGNTFDAHHLDRFMQTEYGERAVQMVLQDAKDLKYGSKFYGDQQLIPIQTNIRPDPCFLTVPRQMRKEVVSGVSSKPMQLAQQRVNVLEKSPYKGDYDKLDELQKQFDPKKLINYAEDKNGQSPQDRRKELEEVKRNMKSLHEYKEAHAFANKRNRVVKAGWKNGIQGVDSVMNPKTFFYKDLQEQLVNQQAHDDEINQKNRESSVRSNA